MLFQSDTVVSRCTKHHTIQNQISLREGELVVKNLVNDEEILQAYRLRYGIFCNELGWALQSQNGLEIDEYDEHAISLGVLDERGELLAFVRIILAEKGFMIEKEFLSLIDPLHIIRAYSAPIQAPIPAQFRHLFRLNSGHHSAPFRAPSNA